jgi:hypothetical protein
MAQQVIVQFRRLSADDHALRLRDALLELRKPLPTTAAGRTLLDDYIASSVVLLSEISAIVRHFALFPDEKPFVVELIQHLEGLQAPPYSRIVPGTLDDYLWLKDEPFLPPSFLLTFEAMGYRLLTACFSPVGCIVFR